MIKLAWGNKVDQDFRDAVIRLCKNLGWDEKYASWLMACIAFETAESFDPAQKNLAGSSATGLIQFMPKTAVGLGTTTTQLEGMGAPQQMTFVEKYFKPYANSIKTLQDMYMAILAPKAVGMSPGFVLYTDSRAYRANSALDSDSDGRITKFEAAQFVRAKLDKGLAYGNWLDVAWNDDNFVLAKIARIEQELAELKTMIAG